MFWRKSCGQLSRTLVFVKYVETIFLSRPRRAQCIPTLTLNITLAYPNSWGEGGRLTWNVDHFKTSQESGACRPKILKQMDAFSCIVGDFETVFCRGKISLAVVYGVTNQLVLYEYLNRNIYNAMTISTPDFVPCSSAGAYRGKRSRGCRGLTKLAPASCRANQCRTCCLLGGDPGACSPGNFWKKGAFSWKFRH